MKSSIVFSDEVALAKFLSVFLPESTVVFTVKSYDGTAYILEFTGGY